MEVAAWPYDAEKGCRGDHSRDSKENIIRLFSWYLLSDFFLVFQIETCTYLSPMISMKHGNILDCFFVIVFLWVPLLCLGHRLRDKFGRT